MGLNKSTNFNNFIFDFKKRHSNDSINIGSSLVMIFKEGILFTLSKEKNWRRDDAENLNIDFAGIGGSFENNETPFECLKREIKEETSLKFYDLEWHCPSSCEYIDISNNTKKSEVIFLENDPVKPFAVLEIKVGNKLKRSEEKGNSFLLLFIYLGRSKSNDQNVFMPEPDLPGYCYIDGKCLDAFFKGKTIIVGMDKNSGFEIYLKNGFEDKIKGKVLFTPKFTPLAIMNSGFKYENFLVMINDQQKYENHK